MSWNQRLNDRILIAIDKVIVNLTWLSYHRQSPSMHGALSAIEIQAACDVD